MISIWIVLYLLFAHYVCDFVCQTEYMALNKSKSNKALGLHVITYGFFLSLFSVFVFTTFYQVVCFVLINIILHFNIDYYTSRLTSYLAKNNKFGSKTIPNFGFYSVIGFDQFLHYVCLLTTYVSIIQYI